MNRIVLLGAAAALVFPAAHAASPQAATAQSVAVPSAAAPAAKTFDISAQPLSKALLEFSRQADLIVTVAPELVQGRNAPAIRGALAPMTALLRLLEGTGLQASRTSSGGITIVSTATSMQSSASPALQLAQAVPTAVSEAQASAVASAEPAGHPAAEKGIPEMLVKGAKFSINADIQRTEDDVQPYVVFTAEEIQSSMAMNLEDFFKMRLSMAKVMRSVNGTGTASQGKSGSNQSSVNLRGLGVDETLVLVNGRRVPGVSAMFDSDSDSSGAFNQPDINGIALNQIERIEILPSTASGIYGGGATGGVINIILKNDYSGMQTTVNYANVFDTDAGTVQATVNGGFSLEGGRTHVSMSANYSDANAMLTRDRDFILRTRILRQQNDPQVSTTPYSYMPLSYTTNIRSAQQVSFSQLVNLTMDDGRQLNSPITHVPVGYAGVTSDGGNALYANRGVFNLDMSDDLNGGLGSQSNNPKTHSLRLNVTREFGERFSMFGDFSQSENNGRVDFAGNLQNSARILASAPNNPFQQDIDVVFPAPGISYERSNSSKALNAVVGGSLRLPARWNLQAEYSWGRTSSETVGGSPFVNQDIRNPPFFGPVIREGIASYISNGRLDVLRDLNADPLDLGNFLLDYPNFLSGPAKVIMTGAVLRGSGPLFELPGGSLTFSGAFDHRNQKAESALQKNYVEFMGGYFWSYEPERSSDYNSVYAELFAPLVSQKNSRPGVRLLELQASLRRDDYTVRQGRIIPQTPAPNYPDELPGVAYTETGVASNGYTLGFRYGPTEDVTLRASYSYGFKPPSVTQISPETTTNSYVNDPERGQYVYYPVPVVIRGGNPNLKPETSDSYSAGLIVTPSLLPGLRLSLDYTQMKKKGEISSLWDALIIQNVDLFPDRVVRAPPTGDGLPGLITFIDLSLVNIHYTALKALDLQADYLLRTPRGDFNFYVVGTRNTEFVRQLTPDDVLVDSVGHRDGPLDWRANSGVTWKRGNWMLGWNMQYYDSYFVYPSDDADSPGQVAYLSMQQGSPKVSSQNYHDISFRYRFGEVGGFGGRLFADTEISGGIQNVLNTLPPPFLVSGDMGFSAYGDARLRRYSLQLTKNF